MRILAAILPALLATASLHAQPLVGETHRQAEYPAAALRDGAHRPLLRITIWFPAAAGAVEQPILIGPDTHPLFTIGTAAMDAAPAADAVPAKRPVILLSHGFGGSARMMGWFGIAMARAGYVVIAVDHPGNNGLDPMSAAGALLSWERAGDLRRALDLVRADTIIGPHIDATRVGLAGFSAGGFTALVGAGARADPARFEQFCAAHPDDGVCKPQIEFAITPAQRTALGDDPAFAAVMRHAGEDHSIPHVRAVFAMAPAIVQGLAPTSLQRLAVPVSIVLGAADNVAPPPTNGETAARLIPHARLHIVPAAGHYDFLAECAPDAQLPICALARRQKEAHQVAIEAATRLFRDAL